MRSAAAVIFLTVAAAQASTETLGDAVLLQMVSTLHSAKQSPADRILGVHNGARVIVDERCSGVCPDRTVRIFHYMTGTNCTAVKGDTVQVEVPRGLSKGDETFCVPHILYLRKLYTDNPYGR